MAHSFKLRLIFIAASLFPIYSACSNPAQLSNEPQKVTPISTSIKGKYLNPNRAPDPTEKVLVAFIKGKNYKNRFVENIAKKIDFLLWDYAVITKTNFLAEEIPTHLL